MAALKPGVIALFDVDGTLTAPRKVFYSFTDNYTPCVWLFSCYQYSNAAILYVQICYQIYCLINSIVK